MNYSFLNSVLLINGVEIDGFDEGDDVISLERLEDSASHKTGADGKMSIAIHGARVGQLVFRLMQTSVNANRYLSALINAQENGVFVPTFILFKGFDGGDLCTGTQGYINRPAPIKRGTGIMAQEWRITTERLDLLHNING